MDSLSASRSMLGQQIESTKISSPITKVGSSTRTTNEAQPWMVSQKLGAESRGVFTEVKSTFGPQALSTKASPPSIGMGAKSEKDYKMVGPDGVMNPGPGSYDYQLVDKAIGKQPLAHSKGRSMPEIKIPSGGRFSQSTSPDKNPFSTPGPDTLTGSLGDSPHSSLGKGSRTNVYGASEALSPTYIENPGPGAYDPSTKSMGPQQESTKLNSPKAKLGTSQRDDRMKMFTGKESEKELYGKLGPGPGGSLPSDQYSSKVKSPTGGGWGKSAGDRFSQVKGKEDSLSSGRAASPSAIGPGSYTV